MSKDQKTFLKEFSKGFIKGFTITLVAEVVVIGGLILIANAIGE